MWLFSKKFVNIVVQLLSSFFFCLFFGIFPLNFEKKWKNFHTSKRSKLTKENEVSSQDVRSARHQGIL